MEPISATASGEKHLLQLLLHRVPDLRTTSPTGLIQKMSSFAHLGLESRNGRYQTYDDFRIDVYEDYTANQPVSTERNVGGMQSLVFEHPERRLQILWLLDAKEAYKITERKTFTKEKCWMILKDHPKWQNVLNKKGNADSKKLSGKGKGKGKAVAVDLDGSWRRKEHWQSPCESVAGEGA
ncbi:hypothetical protein BDB00DRAFT_878800 [Zychaea mexicana]|uniref:uncharacterized protein n=1 Tax=Zychaea mexicana TaxID=64656 RepID=UPI0022FE2A48|nr:uncharacterized protein BDB00DRAFT_878800 [Zychaea mexicana]KAI9484482.1 hypothetical protein BDB00DRAFT_878800 [Zychaea mexicana]